MDEEAVGVFDLGLYRIGGFEFGGAALFCVDHAGGNDFLKEPFWLLNCTNASRLKWFWICYACINLWILSHCILVDWSF